MKNCSTWWNKSIKTNTDRGGIVGGGSRRDLRQQIEMLRKTKRENETGFEQLDWEKEIQRENWTYWDRKWRKTGESDKEERELGIKIWRKQRAKTKKENFREKVMQRELTDKWLMISDRDRSSEEKKLRDTLQGWSLITTWDFAWYFYHLGCMKNM